MIATFRFFDCDIALWARFVATLLCQLLKLEVTVNLTLLLDIMCGATKAAPFQTTNITLTVTCHFVKEAEAAAVNSWAVLGFWMG